MTDLSEKIVEAGARAAAREACSAADVEAWVDAHWPMYVGEVEVALRAVLPIMQTAVEEVIAEWVTHDQSRVNTRRAVRTRLSEIMDGLK